ncbi:hypothetical protein IVA86_24645, partial [Bradyrhizobium sp. 146]|nr:hypothetical protein [Bradyrhizobium sp. CW11]MCK1704517.1 hypothetical protein [Bradyrhizobium sp. 146]
DPAMTLAAIDRLVHHATIVEMNVESYRRRTALERKRGPRRHPPTRHQKHSLIDPPRGTKLLRPTIIAAIITSRRHRLAILIVARFPSRLMVWNSPVADSIKVLKRGSLLATPHG